MTYRETIKYLESFINYERISDWGYKESFRLDSFRVFLKSIGNPQNTFPSIHVAGSKGKGSTCAFISYILREAGYKIGLYTSPHLLDFGERIRILCPQCPSALAPKSIDCFEGKIPRARLVCLVERLKPFIDKHNSISKYNELSFFEVYTALAFVYFKEKKIDFAVIETGLGGRLDATNVVNSLVCAITPISYEHTQKLGNTLREIAGEKAGIIKSNQAFKVPPAKLARSRQKFWQTPGRQLIVVTAPQEKEALDVIKNRCGKVKARLLKVGSDIVYKKTKKGFAVKGILGKYQDFKIKLLGRHQLMNATVAIGMVEGLRSYGVAVGIDSIQKGVYNTLWPGRCEVVASKPLIILDGAQNAASAGVLKNAIKENFRYHRLVLILGISSDKDKLGICRQLCDFADEIILTQADNPRAASVEDIEKNVKVRPKAKVIKTKSVKDAMKKARAVARESDLILVTGSLFVVAEARQLVYKWG